MIHSVYDMHIWILYGFIAFRFKINFKKNIRHIQTEKVIEQTTLESSTWFLFKLNQKYSIMQIN